MYNLQYSTVLVLEYSEYVSSTSVEEMLRPFWTVLEFPKCQCRRNSQCLYRLKVFALCLSTSRLPVYTIHDVRYTYAPTKCFPFLRMALSGCCCFTRYILSRRPRPGVFNHDKFITVASRNFSSQSSDKQNHSLVPGVALAATTAAAGFQAASILTSTLGIPVSGIPLSILLGMLVKNSSLVYPDDSCKAGITFATKTILQGGIVAVAANLSFFDLLTTGSSGIPVVLASVGTGLLFIPAAGRLAGLPKDMSLLLTAGTSICGVTAITALAPAIHASNRATAVAVANTVAFGTLGMLVYPYVFHELCASSEQVGMCLGVAIHDTSQVLGSAMSYKETFDDETALRVAAVTKLTRNLGLAFAIPALTFSHKAANTRENASEKEETMSGLATFQQYVPPFLIAFLAMSAFRSC